MALSFAADDVRACFPERYFERGQHYQSDNRVLGLAVGDNGMLLTANVHGNRVDPYRVYVRVLADDGRYAFDGECTCPVGFNCKHVVATLFEGLSRVARSDAAPRTPDRQPDQVDAWLAMLREALAPDDPESYSDDIKHRLLYVLRLQPYGGRDYLLVEPTSTRLLKSGSYSGESRYEPVNVINGRGARYLRPSDRYVLRALALQEPAFHTWGQRVEGIWGADLLRRMLETDRCHWLSIHTPPLRPAAPRRGSWNWRLDPDGTQSLHCRAGHDGIAILPLLPLWYVDPVSGECGPVDQDVPTELAVALLSAPPVPPDRVPELSAALPALVTGVDIPKPKLLDKAILDTVEPTPCLRLHCAELEQYPAGSWGAPRIPLDLALARLSFDYDDHRVDAGATDEALRFLENDTLVTMARDAHAERRAASTLSKFGLVPAPEFVGPAHPGDWSSDWVFDDGIRSDRLLDFNRRDVPALRAAGWRISIDEDYPYRFAEPGEWLVDVEGDTSNAWFDLAIGITVDGATINLLPILVEALQRFGMSEIRQFAQQAGGRELIVPLEDGRLLPIPWLRINDLISILVELAGPRPLDAEDRLRLPALVAGQLHEIDAALDPAHLQWRGNETWRRFGERLHTFKGLVATQPPPGLEATLRDYQRTGLSWLQFLREFDLGGILADDMGLGKTVQALAHILSEKVAGRLDRPCLVVAPTSVISNWRVEAAHFTPDVKVLTLHGPERNSAFDSIPRADLVLTTYPLLPRDRERLLENEYHLLVLDEAQFIKNPKTKAARIVREIVARGRLCLTGTPMENHLGELWSLVDFLMPGLLGDTRQFRQLFRDPIEKYGDGERRKILAKRLAPILLRRRKEDVAAELPAKSEIVHYVELSGAQRDLYETVRLRMNRTVKGAIDRLGIERSQITILDALLKLRQVCCDPRLVKLDAARHITESAKLSALMDLLPEMLAEGRRILLFSQFTSMLKLIEQQLHTLGIDYAKLTGSTRKRDVPIRRFQAGEVPLFLISLKAGGTGLNLTAADTVIHYDPWWNPAVERQATDRAHRIGQDKPVFVYKLITLGTVEEQILALQARKHAIADSVYTDSAGDRSLALTADDLSALFAPLDAP